MMTQTVTVSIGDRSIPVCFTVGHMLALEGRMNLGLQAIYEQVRQFVVWPDVLDGRRLSPEELQGLSDEDRDRLTVDPAAAEERARSIKVGAVAGFVAANVGMPAEELLERAGVQGVMHVAGVLVPAFLAGFVAMYRDPSKEPAAGEGKGGRPTDSSSPPGPGSSSAFARRNSKRWTPALSGSSDEPGTNANSERTTAPA